VKSVDQNGATITGYYNVLRTGTGARISTGYTTKTYTNVVAGTNYQIELDSFGSCTFQHWQDTGSTTNPRSFAQANGPMTFVGIYNCTSGGSVGQPGSIGGLLVAMMSEFAMPVGLLALTIGSLAVVRTKTLNMTQRSTHT
jgi:hypothetical protein